MCVFACMWVNNTHWCTYSEVQMCLILFGLMCLCVPVFMQVYVCIHAWMHVHVVPHFTLKNPCMKRQLHKQKLHTLLRGRHYYYYIDYTKKGKSTQCAATNVSVWTRWVRGNQPPSHKLWSAAGAETRRHSATSYLMFRADSKKGADRESCYIS